MHYKRTNYFKILGNLRGYLKEYAKFMKNVATRSLNLA